MLPSQSYFVVGVSMLLEGKRCLIFGVANTKSIAYGIADAFAKQGAKLAMNYFGDALKKRVLPIAEELHADFTFPCNVSDDTELLQAVNLVKKQWGSIDVLVHSVAFANKDELAGRFIDTSKNGFNTALEISAFSLPYITKHFEPLLVDGASIITLSYYGAEKFVPNYNVMGIAKSALESSVRYLAMDLGIRQIRVNAISAGPIKTLAASGISDFSHILRMVEEKAPLKRNVTQEEVGDVAVFLASSLSRAVTGEVLHVDCGYNTVGV